MDVNLGLAVAVALLAALGCWRERTLNELGRTAAAARGREELLRESYESCKRRIAEQETHLRQHGERFAEIHRLHAEALRQKDIDAAGERHALMERIQRPEHEPVAPVGDVGANRKLHWSEDDEVQGVTPGQVAAAAGLTLEHERVIAHIDEIAVAEGTG